MSLKVNEIFHSIQGEGSYAGFPCVFIRLTGCHLRCTWCDSEYSFYEGDRNSIAEIVEKVSAFNCTLVEVTGGEPLLQKESIELMKALHEKGFRLLLETSGAVSIEKVPEYVHIVLDLKAPGSGEEKRNLPENISLLKSSDDIKIVIKDRNDFDWVEKIAGADNRLSARLIHLQPVFGVLDPGELSEWIKQSQGKFRLSLQLHKYIYDPTLRGV